MAANSCVTPYLAGVLCSRDFCDCCLGIHGQKSRVKEKVLANVLEHSVKVFAVILPFRGEQVGEPRRRLRMLPYHYPIPVHL